MSYDPNGWGGGGGGSYSPTGWGGGGATRARAGSAKKPAKSNPTHDLASSLVRLGRTLPKLSGGQSQKVQSAIIKQSQGLPDTEFARVRQSVPDSIRPFLDAKRQATRKSHDAIDTVTNAGESLVGKVFNAVAAPGRADLSAIAEYSRQYEKQGRPFLPTNVDFGKVLKAGAQGFQDKRHDSFTSISKEAGDIRAKQGASTQIFGGALPWKNDLRTNPVGGGKIGNIIADTGVSVATDPLTYLSFGTSGLVKAGIKGAVESIGAERTAALVDKGFTALDAEEKARLAKDLAPKVFTALKRGARGGVQAHVPKVPFARQAARNVPRTIVPGPLRGLKAAKIIEGSGGKSAVVEKGIADAEQVATEAASRAKQMHASADLAETQGADVAHVAALRGQAVKFDELAGRAATKAEEVAGTAQRTATTAAEHLRDTPVGHFVQAVSDSAPVQALGRAFIPRYAISKGLGEGAAQQLADANARFRGGYQSAVADDVNLIGHAVRSSEATADELKTVIGPALDIGGSRAAVEAYDGGRLVPVFDAMDEVRKRFTQAQIDAGVASEQALHQTDEYLARYRTPEAQKLLGTERDYAPSAPVVPGQPNLTRRPSSNLNKRTENIEKPIAEINKEFQAEHGVNQYEPNPLVSTLRRSTEAHGDVANRKYVGDLLKMTDSSGKRFAYTDAELKGGGLTPSANSVAIDVHGVGTIHVPKEIATEVQKSMELVANDQSVHDFLHGMDKLMTLWKGWATVPLPFGLGFHERNAMGNVFLNYLAGIPVTAKEYIQASVLQNKVWRGARQGDAYKFLSPEQADIIRHAREDNTLGSGFFQASNELGTHESFRVPFRSATAAEKGKRVAKAANPFSTEHFAPVTAGRKFGSSIEENARLAHYLYKYRETGSFALARQSVAKYLFDYGDLTGFERNVMKRFQAFYTFKRKATPVILGSLLQTPGKYSHIQALRTAVASQAERPKGLYPSYLPELGGTPLPMEASRLLADVKVPDAVPVFGGYSPLGFKPNEQNALALDLPYLNTFSELQPYAQLAAETPGLKAIPGLPKNPEGVPGIGRQILTQEISGGAPGALSTFGQAFVAQKDAFSGRPLTGRSAAPFWAKLLHLDQNRVLNGGKQATIDTKDQYIAESLMPILGKLSTTFPQGAYEQEKGPRRRLSTFTGIRTYPLGPGAQRGEALRRNSQVAQLIADLRAAGITIPSSRSKAKSLSGWGG